MNNTNDQYLKCKDDLKKKCIYNAIFGGLMLITTILFIFVPFFEYKESVLGIDFRIGISFFDEISLCLQKLTGGNKVSGLSESPSSSSSMADMFSYYHIMAMVCLLVGIGLLIYEFVKNIIAIVNIDDYALKTYDTIKKNNNKRVVYGKPTALSMFISFIFLELMYLLIFKNIAKTINKASGVIIEEINSYFEIVNSINALVLIVLVFLIASIVMKVLALVSHNKVKVQILKDEYQVEKKA